MSCQQKRSLKLNHQHRHFIQHFKQFTILYVVYLGGAIVHNVKNINIDYKHIELIAEVCINDLVRLFKNNFVNFVETLNGGDW